MINKNVSDYLKNYVCLQLASNCRGEIKSEVNKTEDLIDMLSNVVAISKFCIELKSQNIGGY